MYLDGKQSYYICNLTTSVAQRFALWAQDEKVPSSIPVAPIWETNFFKLAMSWMFSVVTRGQLRCFGSYSTYREIPSLRLSNCVIVHQL